MTEQPPVIELGARVGIIGGGQLGRMLAEAAVSLGYAAHVYTDLEGSPASHTATKTKVGSFTDLAALEAFAREVDVLTYEFEHLPADNIARTAEITPLRPGALALATAQDRLLEKDFLAKTGVGLAPYAPFMGEEALRQALRDIGLPAVAKKRHDGYDGKGQYLLDSMADVPDALAAMEGRPAVLEGFVDFECEVSAITCRGLDGLSSVFPITRNDHRAHILAESRVPADIGDRLDALARVSAARIADALDYTGVLAVEYFVTKSDELLVNEIAPRVHNSGHWTIEGAETSQFEQHIRAICGMALGPVDLVGPSRMRNLLGQDMDDLARYQADPAAHVHLYGKTKASPGRKMGHVTWVGSAAKEQ